MSFNNIYGHSGNISFFKRVFELKQLSHSYIFEGPEGIGKQLFAINLAKSIMCKNTAFDSCEKCVICTKINNMNHPDLMIVQPDGNSIKNSQVKEFQNFLSYKPNESENKIVIINDSNKMTISAQNSILKILEDPPEYVVIVFISNNSNNLLETIKSRCQVIRFNKLKIDDICKFLINEYEVLEKEAFSIALFSDGIISKAFFAYKNSVFLDMREKVIDYSNQLLLNNKINAIKGIDYLNNEKDNILLIFDIMLSWIRDILIVQNSNNYDIVINKDKNELIKKISYKLADKNLIFIIEMINQTIKDLNNNVNYKLAIDNLILNIIE